MDLAELHQRALDATGAYVAAVAPDQWHLPTPCHEFDVAVLVNHIVAGNLWVQPLVSGRTIAEVGDRLDGDVLGDDPVAAYRASADEAGKAFSRAGVLDAMVAVSYGPVPGAVYAGHRVIDVLIHGWDLAVATGQDATIDADLVEGCREVVEPQAELLAGTGVFATDVEVPAGADAQTRLLAILGRRA